MKISIEVPDDSPLAQEIGSWEDGQSYDLKVTQVAPREFTLDDAGASEEAGEEEEPDAPEGQSEGDEETGESPMPRGRHGKMPAIAIVIKGGKK